LEINGGRRSRLVLAKLRQDKALSDVFRDLKAGASGWLHKVFPELKRFARQNGDGAFTVSASQAESVHRYIAKQPARHQRQSFEDELMQLLRLHEVDLTNAIGGNETSSSAARLRGLG